MRGLSLVQSVYAILAVPVFMWAFASALSAAGMRNSARTLSPRCVWLHQTAETLLRRGAFVLLMLAATAAALWGLAVLG